MNHAPNLTRSAARAPQGAATFLSPYPPAAEQPILRRGGGRQHPAHTGDLALRARDDGDRNVAAPWGTTRPQPIWRVGHFMHALLALAIFCARTCAFAQEGRLQQIRPQQPGQPLSARDFAQHSEETPLWKNPAGFERDVFTFVRIRYSSGGGGGGFRGFRGSRKWATDFPDADLNFSWRLQQMTSLKVDPEPKLIELTDPVLFRYPFIYIVEPGQLEFTDEERTILRRYLLNGGFLMFDDFWGEDEWDNVAEQMKRVFPDRDFTDLDRKEHPVFHNVFELPVTLNLQCPNYRTGEMSQYTGVTWEREDARETHIRGITDDKGRLMVIACHNTDNGDGWEREGEYHYYFKEFSEKKAYPLGINIIFYVMTH